MAMYTLAFTREHWNISILLIALLPNKYYKGKIMEFKVGDWIIDQYDKHLQLNNSHFYGVSSRTPNWFDNLKPWQPKEGEWCWFWNET